ncbi:MAG: PspA/IM30 family protein [Shewanella psychromarinicola]|jgi:phage shock protein A|uniref:PspA/IM30 family protein n=1 Tax=Shewanella psychromarinicola TaxID=2487742 RepID=A0A3N4E4W9_9GAMM|nr:MULTISPECIES: PspA/IM30 family protein [Shewanella]AZG34966.1 PspA/IM30 family protein [Shewanella psychromarinicola]MCL1080613.1 PspA/IM30 family protein [Shewanella psychromarinicola]PKG79961.1 phage shock protein A [Shewanella sp. Actino-trap-3]RPA33239.1 PspA/IM30 family protein [Shewanella psychromarinicola]|tara:strand:- start:56895 stop:57584 length:690 start_codon:yes stop_codon:yes gene_type:complete
MGILNKILTAFRGGATEVGQTVVDANSTRIFEQEIRDAEKHLTRAKRELTDVMAKEMQASREIDRLKRSVTEHEGYVAQALDKGNEALAIEIAEKIAQLDEELSEQQTANDSFSSHALRLKDLVKKTERQLNDYQRQLTMVKTTESVQKATATITDSFASSNSKLLNAKDSLERIKARQQQFDDRLKASETLADESSDKSLHAKLAQAGIGEQKSNANAVLDRIKARKG